MSPERTPAGSSPSRDARVVVLEAAPGQARRALLDEWLAAARREGASSSWLLSADVRRHGMWAGLNEWMEALLPALEKEAPELFVRHDSELVSVLPALRLRVAPRYVTLTDTAESDEGVRNYARDRAFRIGHGLIDMLDAWHERAGGGTWAVACDHFDRRGVLVGDFFRNLVRRRGARLGLSLLVAVDPGKGERTAAEFQPFARVERVRAEVEPGPEEAIDPAEASRRAEELEGWAMQDTLTVCTHSHEAIRLWEAAGRPDRAVFWHALALGVFNHLGFYGDALRHADPVRERLTAFDEDQRFYNRAMVVGNLQTVYIASGEPETALEILERESLHRLTDPADRARAFYMVAMLHARFLPRRDQEAGARYIQCGLEEVERADLEPGDRHFLTGFLLNGLAYVRVRQGDFADAAALSHGNHARLDEHLPADRHRLHRSVLLYNAGQVHAQTGESDEAIRCFSEAIVLDPNYSEYYNDRGSVFLKLNRLEEAERDYLRAIDLSPPYPEVWFNLGQCYARMGRPEDGERAYARAVDLDPARNRAWVNLARTWLSFGRREDALAAYDAAIAADDTNPFVYANRGALRFELGQGAAALEDLDRAVALAPEHPALRRNRAVVLEALGRRDRAGLGEPVA